MFSEIKHKCWEYFLNKVESSLIKRKKKSIESSKNEIFKRLQSVGFDCSLSGNRWVFEDTRKIILGNNIHIGNNFYVAGAGGLIIGDNTHISRNVSIYTVNHNYQSRALPYDATTNYKSVHIGKNVWIGMNVSIIPGITIGDGAIIEMGSVVNRNVGPLEIVGTPPVNLIKKRKKEHYEELDNQKAYGGVNGKLLKSEDIRKFLPSYSSKKKSAIVFILGTGRSGSKSIVKTLNQNPTCKAFHEDIQQLIRISTKIAEQPQRKEFYLQELKDIFNTKIWQAADDQILVHSDQRFWNLIPFLNEYFPNAKFIHLKREKYSCIKSMYARKWYNKDEYPKIVYHDWAKYRLQADRIGEISKKQWQELNPLQKCTWYWYYVNHTIETELKKIDNSKILSINLEDLNNVKDKLSFFLFTQPFNFEILKSNQVRRSDSKTYENLDENKLKSVVDKTLEDICQ